MQKFISILNAVSGASDCVTTSGTTAITGLTPFKNVNLQSLQVFKNLVATPMKWSFSTGALTTGNVVSFRVVQTVNGIIRDSIFSYTFDSYANLDTAISNWFTAEGFEATYANTSVSSTVDGTITASSSNISITVSGISYFTETYSMPTLNPNATAATAVSGTTTVTVAVLAAQTFSTGETVTITGATGFTFTKGGVATVGSVTARITYASATTFTLDGVTGSGTNTGTIVITKVAQDGFGSIADVNADASASGSSQTATQTTYQYNCAKIRGTYPASTNGSLQIADVYEATLWYPANLIASPFTAFTNTSALESALAAIAV